MGEFVAGFIAIGVVALVCSDADGLSDFTSEMLCFRPRRAGLWLSSQVVRTGSPGLRPAGGTRPAFDVPGSLDA